MNALAFGDTNFVFSRLTDHVAEERKRYDFEKLQKDRNEWNRDWMKHLDFMNKRLREKLRWEHISTMLMKQCLNTIAYLQKKIKPFLPNEPELSDFYHPSKVQKNGELLFVVVVTGVATHAL